MQSKRIAYLAATPFFLPIALAILFIGVFLTTTLCAVAAMLVVAIARMRAPKRTIRTDASVTPQRRMIIPTTLLAASSLTLFHTAMFMGSIALPIVVTHNLGGTKAEVGLIFSVCALLEVVVMSAFVFRPSSPTDRRWLSAGFVAFVVYFLVITCAPSVAIVLGAQLLRAIGIGLIGCQGISYIQALMPNRVGSAATLFSNTRLRSFPLARSQ